jgi:hypothetical protein
MRRIIALLFFLSFLFLNTKAWAVPIFDNVLVNYTSGASSTVTISFTIGGTDRLITACIASGGTTVDTVTYGAGSLLPFATPIVLAGVEISYWGLINPASGPNNLVVTPAVSGADLAINIVSYKDVLQTGSTGTVVSCVG